MTNRIQFIRRLLCVGITNLFIILIHFNAEAQSAGNYSFTSSTTGSLVSDKDGNPVDMLTGTTQLHGANVTGYTAVVQNLGFTFYFMGSPYTQFTVNPDGALKFGPSAITFATQNFTSPILFPVNTDNKTAADGKVHFKVQGTSPNSVLIVEWKNILIPTSGTANTTSSTFQLRLYESNGTIEYVYGQMHNTAINSTSFNTGFASASVAGKVGQVVSITSSPVFQPTSNALLTNSFSGNSAMTNLNSLSDGNRRIFTFTPPVPVAPSNLVLTTTTVTNNLTWTDNSNNEVGFVIFKSTDGVNYTLVTTTAANVTSSLQTGLSQSQLYYWKVAAITEGNVSPFVENSISTSACSLIGTKTIPGDYPSITSAINDMKLYGLAGPLILELQSNYNSSVETFPLALNSILCASSTNTITIRPAANATALSITSSTGPTVNIDGGNYWIIDGRPGGAGLNSELSIINTNSTSNVNNCALRFRNGGSNNQLRYVRFNSMSAITTNGVITFDATNPGNSNNIIDGCQIDCNAGSTASPNFTVAQNGIYSVGNTTTKNLNNTVSNSSIFNFFFTGSNSLMSTGIYLGEGNTDWTIDGNSFYQTSPRTPTATGSNNTTVASIYINNANANNFTITNNFIGGRTPQCGGSPWTFNSGRSVFYGVYSTNGTNGSLSLQGNVISNISLSSSSGIFYGFECVNGTMNIGNISGNTIGKYNGSGAINLTMTISSSTVRCINANNNLSGNMSANISNNIINSFNINFAAPTGVLNFIGIINTFSNSVITNNIVGDENIINGINVSATVSVPGLNVTGINTNGANCTVSNNKVVNLSGLYTFNASNYSAYLNGIIVGTGGTVNNNIVHDLILNSTANGSGTLSISGISMGASGVLTKIITNNLVYALYNKIGGSGSNIEITGLRFGSYDGSAVISRNFIYGLYTAGTFYTVYGIYGDGYFYEPTDADFQNNMVSLGFDTTGNSITSGGRIYGIYDNSSGFDYYHNTVYIGGTGVINSTNNSYCFYHYGYFNSKDIRNNIFLNERSNAGVGGKHYAFAFLQQDHNPSDLIMDYNILKSIGNGGVFGSYGTDILNLNIWRSISGNDTHSRDFNPCLVNPAAGFPDLHLANCPNGNPAESAGTFIGGITDDFDGQMRSSLTPVDIGADAGLYLPYTGPHFGDYANATVYTGENLVITPSSSQNNITNASLSIYPEFKGVITLEPATGVIRVTNARDAGTYLVTLKSGAVSTGFNLIVKAPVCNPANYIKTEYDFASDKFTTDIAIGDFNNDGNQDIVTNNSHDAFIYVLFGNGAGAISGVNTVQVGVGVTSMAVGDFNSDGNQDLAVACQNQDQLYILNGNGLGSFTNSGILTTGDNPLSVITSDFNKDGFPDLATGNFTSENVSIFLNNGSGSFSLTSTVNVFGGSRQIDAGDFNLDGNSDILSVNSTNSTVSALFGNGTGGFVIDSIYTVGNFPGSIDVAYFNGLYNPGFVIASPANNTLTIRNSYYFGDFYGSVEVLGSNNPNYCVGADLNGDEWTDIITSNDNGNSVSVYISDQFGTFKPPLELPANPLQKCVEVCDLNNDSIPDILSAGISGDISIFTGQKNSFKLQGNYNDISNGSNIISSSINTDFGQVPVNGSVSRTFVVHNTGAAPFQITSVLLGGLNATDFSSAANSFPVTINGGDSLYFFVSCNPSSVGTKNATVIVNYTDCTNKNFSFNVRGNAVVPSIGSYNSVSVITGGNIINTPLSAPVNTQTMFASASPNFKGVVTVNPATGVVRITNAYPAGAYTIKVQVANLIQQFTLTVTNPLCSQAAFTSSSISSLNNYNIIGTGDFNNDGNQDLVISDSLENDFAIGIGNGMGGFTKQFVNLPNDEFNTSIAIGDINGDGNQDIVVNQPYNKKIIVLAGNGTGGFTLASSTEFAYDARQIILGDFNNDSKLDLAATVSSFNEVVIKFGDGSGTFSGNGNISIQYPYFLTSGDFNNDGNSDLAILDGNRNVNIKLGNGLGTFSGTNTLTLSSNVYQMVTADFNMNGNTDLAVSTDGGIVIFLGSGTGLFTSAFTLPTYSLWNIAAGDFNGDGKPDLVGIYYYEKEALLHLGIGNGNFNPVTIFDLEGNPISLTVGDYNNDGIEDFATGNSNQVSVRIGKAVGLDVTGSGISIVDGSTIPSLTNNTDFGNIQPSTPLTRTIQLKNTGADTLVINGISITGTNASSFSLNSFTFPLTLLGGTVTTLTLTCNSSIAGIKNAVVHINYSECTSIDFDFAIKANITTPTLGTYTTTTVTTGENKTISPSAAPSNVSNLYVTTSPNYTGQISVNPTTGIVSVTNAKPTGTFVVTVKSGTVSRTFNLVVTKPSCSQPSFSDFESYDSSSQNSKVAIGDFNNDGNQDFLTVVTEETDKIKIYLGNGAGWFTTPLELFTEDNIYNILVSDFNGDGNQDFVAMEYYGKIHLYTGNGSGNFTSGFDTNLGVYTTISATGDFNNDGKGDLVIGYSGTIKILVGDGGGAFNTGTSISGVTPVDLVVKDVNNDNKQDLIFSNSGNSVIVKLGDGLGGFTNGGTITANYYISKINLGDFNNDGKQDLVYFDQNGGTLYLASGNGLGGFTVIPSPQSVTNASELEVADMNGDGFLDVVIVDYDNSALSYEMSIYTGNGNGTFTKSKQFYTENTLISDFQICDFNEDKIHDIAGIDGRSTYLIYGTANEINLQGNNNNIVDGSTSVSFTNNTNFGPIAINTSLTKSFTIQNTGLLQLTINSITFTGVNASEFVASGIALPVNVPAGGSLNFNITYTPQSGGNRNATIHINNNDCDEADYDFALQGAASCTVASFTTCPGNQNVTAPAGFCRTNVNYNVVANGVPAPTFTYVISGATTGNGNGSGSGLNFNEGITHVSITATNICSNAVCSFDVIVAAGTNDNDACSIDACNTSTGIISHTPVNTNDNNACTTDGCNSSTGIFHNPVNPDDDNACTTDACHSVNGVSHTPVNTNDNNSCTLDGCDTVTGIYHNPVETDDHSSCTNDGCNTSTGIFHNAVTTDDGNACTIDGCDSVTGVYHNAVDTDDQNACTDDGCNSSSGVFHNAVNTDDGNACTTDGCDSVTGVFHNAVETDDHNACTDDGCNTLTGVFHNAIPTDDHNACTTDGCNTTTGAFHDPVSVDDGNACTTDGCDSNTGIYHTPVDPDDGNACTTDYCDSMVGVQNNIIEYDDNNACTLDGCDTVTGIYHHPIDPDDHNACTTDGCDTATGVYHNDVDTDDHDACTIDGCDSQNGIFHIVVFIDDGNACTIDACNTETGEITHTDDSPTVSLTIDPIRCYGETGCVTVTATGGTPPYFGLDTYCGYSAGTYYLDVSDSKGCMITKEFTFEEPPKLNTSISSTPATCAGNDGTATVTASGGVEPYSYLWSPGGATTSSISGLAQGDYICTLTDNNGCQVILQTRVNGGAGYPDTPGPIQGSSGVCRKQSGLIYCITPVASADYYEWLLPAGVTVNGLSNGPCITLTFTSKFKGGFLCVKAHNACGTSAGSCMNVTQLTKKPNTPGTISGPSAICPNATAMYFTPAILNATSYQWTANGGVVIISGQGTNTIVVQTPSNYVKADIKVKAVNCKGVSGQRTRKITKATTCKTAAQQPTTDNQQPTTNLQVFPNPTTGKITVTFNTEDKSKSILKVTDVLGNIVYIKDYYTIEGINSKEINLENFSKGIYMVSLQTSEGVSISRKIIIE